MFRTKKQIKEVSDRLEEFIKYHNNMVRKHNELVKVVGSFDTKILDLQKRHNGLCDLLKFLTKNNQAKKPAKKAAKKTTNKKGK